MKRILILLMALLPTLLTWAVEPEIEVKTTLGDFKLKLYDDTPLHRDNFLKLVENGSYDGMLFHRVIKDFMVQTGDPVSKEEVPSQPLGTGQIGEEIPAEILFPAHYNKYGALAAARDGNPERKSSGSQFYIVTGRKFDRGTATERVMNSLLKERMEKKIQENDSTLEALYKEAGEEAVYKKIDELEKEAISEAGGIPDDVIDTYVNIGGAPHLDGAYTVFGEVIEGMDTVEKIQNVATGRDDRPVEDVRIISMKRIK